MAQGSNPPAGQSLDNPGGNKGEGDEPRTSGGANDGITEEKLSAVRAKETDAQQKEGGDRDEGSRH